MSQDNKWIEITVITSSEAVEPVSAIFYDVGAAGVSIEDPADIIKSNTMPHDWDYIDDKLLPKDTGEVKVKGYFPGGESISNIIDSIKSSLGKLCDFGIDKGKGEVLTREVNEQDWANAWKKYYKPFKIGDNIVIKPSWENYDTSPEDIVIELDPGMAFGTGTHETTRMCIELLEKYIKKDSVVFDIGCGSGILSIASSKLGAAKVTGVDIDEVAVSASRENIMVSKVHNVEIKHGNLFDVIKGKADVIVANIIADVIIKISETTPHYLKPNGVFITSGIIKDRADDVRDALHKNGFDILEVKEMGEWVAIASVLKE